MPSPNLPDPDKIPDMSLPERSDKPAPADHVDVTSSYQPESEPVKRKPLEPTPAPSRPREWQEGDRVLAPWEPMFLYSGTIKQIKIDDARGDQALIEFDDGDDGWVFLYSICPLELKPGQKVFSRRSMGPQFFAAEVLDVSGEEVEVEFEAGGHEWTGIGALRIPCIENGPGAVGTKFGANRPPQYADPPSAGIPSWVWTIGIIIVIAVIRGCLTMRH